MTTVASGVVSSALFEGWLDNLTVASGGIVEFSFLTDNASIEILNGGSAIDDELTDFAFEDVDGTESSSIVANGATIFIENDGLGSGINVRAGGNLEVDGNATPITNSGVAASTQISSGGLMQVEQNGLATGTTLSGGELIVFSGSASATTLSGGLELVTGSASLDSGAVVLSGGVLQAVSSGLTTGATISSGGSAVAETGGVLSGATVSSGGVIVERTGGSGVSNTVSAGGLDVVSSGGVAYEEYVLGEQIVLSGGLVSGDPLNFTVAIESGGLQLISGGQTVNMNVSAGGVELVVSSGLSEDTFVSSAGSAVAETGGVLDAIEVLSGGFSVERYFGSSFEASVFSGGTDAVSSTGIAIAAEVIGLQVLLGGTTSATTVDSGGREVISAGGIASGTIVSGGGREVVSSGGTVQGASLISGGTLVVGGGATIKGAVGGGGSGTLELAGGTGSLSGLSAGGNVTVAGAITSAETFTNFRVLRLDPATNFTLSGNANVGTGRSLIVDGTLTTAGILTVAGSLTLGGSATGARTLAGTGTLSLTGGTTALSTGAALKIAHVTQGGAAAVSVGATALTYAGVWTQTGGTITVAAARTLTFTGTGDAFSGTLTGPGSVHFTAGSDLLIGTTLSVATTITGAAVTLSGAIKNSSTITVTSPDLTIAAAGATLSGFGTLVMTNHSTNKIIGATPAATLTNASETIIGAGQLGGGSMTLINGAGGTIAGNSASVALVIDTGASTVTNSGGIISEGKGGVVIKSAVNNTGALTVTAGTLTVNGQVTGAGTVDIQAGIANFRSSFSENVLFGGAHGELELAKSQSYTGTITGFSAAGGMSLDLRDIAFDAGAASAFFSGNGGTGGKLTVTNGTQTANINLMGAGYNTFSTLSDGHGGTLVFTGSSPTAAPKSAAVAPFVAAMAGFDAGPAHWVPTESGRSPPPLMVALTSRS